MDVVTRKEFCDGFHNREIGEKAEVMMADVPVETVFRAAIGDLHNPPHVWLRVIGERAVCIGESTTWIKVGHFNVSHEKNPALRGYEELNATIVIDE